MISIMVRLRKGLVPSMRIEEEHETDQRSIDRRGAGCHATQISCASRQGKHLLLH